MNSTSAPESLLRFAGGAVLCDPAWAQQASLSWLDPAYWREGGEFKRGGRGEVWFVRGPFGEAVLRHYRRGGLVARMLRDQYLWQGENRTRAFAEYRLLSWMRSIGLPVPQPLAAGYRREGAFYRCDLLTARIAEASTLAELLPSWSDAGESSDRLGAQLARFHAAGVCHADLNAHNILRDAAGTWWLIDFDRGVRRPPQRAWQKARLARLARSLHKLGADRRPGWNETWGSLCAAHWRALEEPK